MLNRLKNLSKILNFFSGSSQSQYAISSTTSSSDRFHAFINRISRLPRLFLLFGAIAILVWPVFDPEGFVTWSEALNTMGENIWTLIFTITGSWATTKLIRDFKSRPLEEEKKEKNTPVELYEEDENADLIVEDTSDNETIRSWEKKRASKSD